MDEEQNVTSGAETGAQGATENSNGQGQNEEKAYSEKDFQSEVDKRVTEALKTEKGKWQSEYDAKLKAEKDEAARLAKMSADERAKAEFDKRVKEFEDREVKHNTERLTFECTKQLAGKKLPVEFASMLTGADAETTKTNIETFEKAFSKAIEDAVTEKLKGKTPKTAGGQSSDAWLSSVRKGAGLK